MERGGSEAESRVRVVWGRVITWQNEGLAAAAGTLPIGPEDGLMSMRFASGGWTTPRAWAKALEKSVVTPMAMNESKGDKNCVSAAWRTSIANCRTDMRSIGSAKRP